MMRLARVYLSRLRIHQVRWLNRRAHKAARKALRLSARASEIQSREMRLWGLEPPLPCRVPNAGRAR